jgi:hypothetical protein
MLEPIPAAEDATLLAFLRDLREPLRGAIRAEWKTPGGPEKVRAAVTDAGGVADPDLEKLERLVADEREAFIVHVDRGDRAPYAIPCETWRDARIERDGWLAEGASAYIEAQKGAAAEAMLRGLRPGPFWAARDEVAF